MDGWKEGGMSGWIDREIEKERERDICLIDGLME